MLKTHQSRATRQITQGSGLTIENIQNVIIPHFVILLNN